MHGGVSCMYQRGSLPPLRSPILFLSLLKANRRPWAVVCTTSTHTNSLATCLHTLQTSECCAQGQNQVFFYGKKTSHFRRTVSCFQCISICFCLTVDVTWTQTRRSRDRTDPLQSLMAKHPLSQITLNNA